MSNPSRREFLKSTGAAICSTGLSLYAGADLFASSPVPSSFPTSPLPAPLPIKKGLVLDMLPPKLSYAEADETGARCGF